MLYLMPAVHHDAVLEVYNVFQPAFNSTATAKPMHILASFVGPYIVIYFFSKAGIGISFPRINSTTLYYLLAGST